MSDRLTRFLYLLVRDELAFGRVERLIAEVEKTDGKSVVFSEPRMAEYMASLAARLGQELKCTCPTEATDHLAECPRFEAHQRSKGWGAL